MRLCSRRRPEGIRPCTDQPDRRPADHVSLKVERVEDHSVRGEEALSGGDGLEAPHFLFASPDREMRVFGSVVFAQETRPMKILGVECS